MTFRHGAGRIDNQTVIIHIYMHLTAYYQIISVSQTIRNSFHHTTLYILWYLNALHWLFIPQGARVAADEVHCIFQ